MDDSADDHIDSLLKTIIDREQQDGKKIDAEICTWRGMMTKVLMSRYTIIPVPADGICE